MPRNFTSPLILTMTALSRMQSKPNDWNFLISNHVSLAPESFMHLFTHLFFSPMYGQWEGAFKLSHLDFTGSMVVIKVLVTPDPNKVIYSSFDHVGVLTNPG